jgi:hypothetical protein
MGMSLLWYLFGASRINGMLDNCHGDGLTNIPRKYEGIPLHILRIAFIGMVLTLVLLTISSAKITALARKVVGSTGISPSITIGGNNVMTVQTWMGKEFFVSLGWLPR